MKKTLLGVLVDVSGSMRQFYEKNTQKKENKRIDSVFDAIWKLTENELIRQNEIFSIAFGTITPEESIDFLSVLKYVADAVDLMRCKKKDNNDLSVEGNWIFDKKGGLFSQKFMIPVSLDYDGYILSDKLPLFELLKKEAPLLFIYLERFIDPIESGVLYHRFIENTNAMQKYESGLQKRFKDETNPILTLFHVFIMSLLETTSHIKDSSIIDRILHATELKNKILTDFGVMIDIKLETPTPHHSKCNVYEKILHAIVGFRIDLPLPCSVEPTTNSFQDVVTTMKKLLGDSKGEITMEWGAIEDVISQYIYGRTPMCKSLRESLNIFKQKQLFSEKILFILTDGQPTDGDPIQITESLKKENVTIITCFIGHSKNDPLQLFESTNSKYSKELNTMIKMSSKIPNSSVFLKLLSRQGWKLPLSGESHLCFQANHRDVVNELCKLVKYLDEKDALLQLIGDLSLDVYINQQKDKFEPNTQIGPTCFANAAAAAIHLALHRIVGREIPPFQELLDKIIDDFGNNGAVTEDVLKKFCPNYKLKYKVTDEKGAREALNKSRISAARFELNGHQWKKFSDFFKNNPKGILTSNDLKYNENDEAHKTGGHAVVLVRCNSNCLTFLNSWGTNWADGGFFRIKDEKVLNKMKFFDIYWTEDQLSNEEKAAFKKKSEEDASKLFEKIPKSLANLTCICQMCKEESKIDDYTGNIFLANCPKCANEFEPKVYDLQLALYLKQYFAQDDH